MGWFYLKATTEYMLCLVSWFLIVDGLGLIYLPLCTSYCAQRANRRRGRYQASLEGYIASSFEWRACIPEIQPGQEHNI
jgi:hypothetical protein